jgi:hypothetical protein
LSDTDHQQEKLVRNERTKLTAQALNTAATSCFAIGIATPIAGYLYNVSGFRTAIGLGTLVLGIAGWIFAAGGLHLAARYVLKGLRS